MTALPRVEQLDRAALVGMTPAAIERARQDGKLTTMLGGTPPVGWSQVGQLTRDDVAELSVGEREQARRGGHLAELLDGGPSGAA